MSAFTIKSVHQVGPDGNIDEKIEQLVIANPVSTMLVAMVKQTMLVIVSESGVTESIRHATKMARRVKEFKPQRVTKIVNGKCQSGVTW